MVRTYVDLDTPVYPPFNTCVAVPCLATTLQKRARAVHGGGMVEGGKEEVGKKRKRGEKKKKEKEKKKERSDD